MLESLQRSFNCKELFCFRCAKQGGDARITGGAREAGLLSLSFHGGSAHVRVHATKRYHLSDGRIVESRWLPAKSNPLTCMYMQKHSFSRDRRRERATEKKRGQTRPRLAKWINDRRMREKRRRNDSTLFAASGGSFSR